MISVHIENNFNSWRQAARKLLQAGAVPEAILWNEAGQNHLFQGDPLPDTTGKSFHVPQKFVEAAETASCFDSGEKWGLFYRLLFRLVHENKHLMEIESDNDVRRIMLMRKAVARDIHKFHAFVRFRKIEDAIEKGGEIFVAWHEPHHFTVEPATPFFVRRFGTMRWSILTPKGCANWDLKELTFSPAAEKEKVPEADASEDMWLTYYRSIFNPFRLKVKAMKKEMPVRHWQTLPETKLIPGLIRQAKS